jgi:hypothetical protein
VNDPQTPREFCAALTAERIDAVLDGDPYAVGVLSDGRAWSLFGAEEGSACMPDEPMTGLLWLEFTSAEDEGTDLLGFLENCTPAQAMDAIKRAATGDYSPLTPFEVTWDAVPPHPAPRRTAMTKRLATGSGPKRVAFRKPAQEEPDGND